MSESGKDQATDALGRVKGCSIVKPIVYGNIARYFGKKREEDGHTHSWTVYLKPFRNEDMSQWVKKVHFKLHESYTNQNRICTKPPYEVTETGWGEFEIVIKIYFHDTNEKPVTIYHILKLFETDPTTKTINVKKNLVSEFYDEIIFQDPSVYMQALLSSPSQNLGQIRHETDFEEKKERTLAAIQSARGKVRHEISDLKERLKMAQETIAKYKEEIQKVENASLTTAVSETGTV